MAIYLNIILDLYFTNYNTKQNYQISNKNIKQSKKIIFKYSLTYIETLDYITPEILLKYNNEK